MFFGKQITTVTSADLDDRVEYDILLERHAQFNQIDTATVAHAKGLAVAARASASPYADAIDTDLLAKQIESDELEIAYQSGTYILGPCAYTIGQLNADGTPKPNSLPRPILRR